MSEEKNDNTDPQSRDAFIHKCLRLLEIERSAEIEEARLLSDNVPLKDLQNRGLCLLKLVVKNCSVGLYGRSVVTFTARSHLNCLPSHSFSPGDIIGVYLTSQPQSMMLSGLVLKTDSSTLSVAFDEKEDVFSLGDDQYNLKKLTNDVTYRRLKRTLTLLGRSQYDSDIVQICFGEMSLKDSTNKSDLSFFNDSLDDSQKCAVQFALTSKDVSVIHGPPGTGKTTTIVEIVQQCVKQKLKLLVCAPSNIAVDNLVERLGAVSVSLVRLGHPARILPHIQKHSLDAQVVCGDQSSLVADVKKDIEKTLAILRNNRKKKVSHLKNELHSLRKEMRTREKAAIREVISGVDVILATLTSLDESGPIKYLAQNRVDVVIIDECSQALEVACWMAILHGSRCVIVGDHHQLPPTIISQQAANEGLSITLMERLLSLHNDRIKCTLSTQYRMHHNIMSWSSETFYNNILTAHCSVARHLLRDLPGVLDNEDTAIPLLLIDTAGCGVGEDVTDDVSKGNRGEVEIVCNHITNLVSSGVLPADIAIISPYNLQVEYLRCAIHPKYPSIEIKSVDGFQGREKEAVVISLVRSNTKGEVGFLADSRRMNVAVTRARRHLAVVGNSECLRSDPMLGSLIGHLQKVGEVRSAIEYTLDPSGDDIKQAKQSKAKRKDVRDDKPLESNTISSKLLKQEKIAKTLQEFASNSDLHDWKFPMSLTSAERHVVHEMAEDLGLDHHSYGEGNRRQIIVSKRGKDEQIRSTKTLLNSLSLIDNVKDDSYKCTTEQNSNAAISCHLSDNRDNAYEIKSSTLSQCLSSQDVTCTGTENSLSDVQNSTKITSDSLSITDKSVIKEHSFEALEGTNTLLSHSPKDTSSRIDNDVLPKNAEHISSTSDILLQGDKLNTHATRTIPDHTWAASNNKGVQNNQPNVLLADICGDAGCNDVKRKDRVTLNQKQDTDKTQETQSASIYCENCRRSIPSDNYELHALRCRKSVSKVKLITVNEATCSRQTEAILKVSKDDVEGLLEAAISTAKKCSFRRCKQTVTVMGQLCRYCGLMFCLGHHMAEVHGCGAAAKQHARNSFQNQNLDSSQRNSSSGAAKHAQLQRKMNKKLTEMSDKRKGARHKPDK